MISFCIPLKNNLRYFKSCYESIKKNADFPYEIVCYIDSDNDQTEQYLQSIGIRYTKNTTNICKGISYGYNRCIEMASGEYVLMFHADMMLGPKALQNLVNYINQGNDVVVLTRIEPPLHPSGNEKIIQNFGLWPEKNVNNGFLSDQFEKYVLDNCNLNKTTKGIFAPWMIRKSDVLAVNMHDELLHSYHEDSDIFNRFILKGYKIIQTWNSLVYHLTCRGGQFQDGLTVTNDQIFHKMKEGCMRNYLRKWGSWIQNDDFHYPIIKNKYDIGFDITNCNINLISALEPWVSTLYVDCSFEEYIKNEQLRTIIDLSKRIKTHESNKENDIIISFNGNNFGNSQFAFIQTLSEVIKDTNEIGTFEYDIFTFCINKLKTYQNSL